MMAAPDHLLNILLHFSHFLGLFLQKYGNWVYAVLFCVVFAETGLVVTPVLPGDSMLFVCGTLAGSGKMSLMVLLPLLIGAAILGDAVNYALGRYWGVRLFSGRWRLQQKHLEQTEAFYRRHGGKTVIAGRFLPVVRTFVPFVAGTARMGYARFFSFNVSGALIWVGGLLSAGFFLGRIPWVKTWLSPILVVLVVLSLLPAAAAFAQGYLVRRKNA